MPTSLYTLILACSALVTSLISLYVLKYRACRASHEFVLLLAAVSWWSATNVMETFVQGIDLKILFSVLSYLGSQSAPVLFFLFALRFTRMDSWMSGRSTCIFFIIPCISFLMAATNGLHHLLWSSVSLAESAFAGSYAVYEHGPWYWIEWIYSFGLILTGIVALLVAAFRPPEINALQCRLILLFSLVPILGNAGYAFFSSTLAGIDPTPFLFSVTGILMAIGITRYWMLDIVPIARDHVLDSITEGVLILDKKNRIIDANPSVRDLLQVSDPIIGKNITDVIPEWYEKFGTEQEQVGVLAFSRQNDEERWLSWSVSDIRDPEEGSVGICLLLRDVTVKYNMEEQLRNQARSLERFTRELSNANKSLQLMTSITRHDILNMITVQRGYSEMAMQDDSPESYEYAVRQSYSAALRIQELINFTREYQDIGTSQPSWMNVATLFHQAARLFYRDGRNLVVSVPDSVEIFVEPLFAKIFFVLIDNSFRHGEKITEIRFFCEHDDDLVLIYEDDGVGIPDNEKKSIFTKGFGKNTGLGLYLAKEILQVYGCSIVETGSSGSGVRFEITVPREGWRENRSG